VLRNEPQFNNVDASWVNWPHQHVPTAVWWYYIIETGFYWSLLLSTFAFDIRRSDFLQMMLHHAVTILLLSMSFAINFVRIGTLVLFSHDAADVFIELGKLLRYGHYNMAVNVVFIIFFTIWIATRLVYYPFWIIHSVMFTAPGMIQESYRWLNILQRPLIPRILLFMLCTLVILHIFWTYVLLRIAAKSLRPGGEIGDVREESEDESDEDDQKAKLKNNKKAD